MAYQNGIYVAFHADGNNIPGGKSDIDYYNLMKAWESNKNHEFNMINSHEKTSAVRDSSKRATLKASLLERLRNSKNMVLIVGERRKFPQNAQSKGFSEEQQFRSKAQILRGFREVFWGSASG